MPWSKPVLLHRKWDGHPPINIAKYPWYVRNPTHDAGMTTTHSCQLNQALSHVHLHGQVTVYIRLNLDVHPSYQLIGIREHLQEIIILPPFLPRGFPVFRFSREIQWSSWCCWMSGYATWEAANWPKWVRGEVASLKGKHNEVMACTHLLKHDTDVWYSLLSWPCLITGEYTKMVSLSMGRCSEA